MSPQEITVRVTPRAHADEIVGRREGVVLVRVRAPALEGRANEAACRVIAARLGVRPGRVTLVRGARSREKTLRIEGVAPQELARRLR